LAEQYNEKIELKQIKKPLKWILGGSGIFLSFVNIILATFIFLTISSSLTSLETNTKDTLTGIGDQFDNIDAGLLSTGETIDGIILTFESLEDISGMASTFGLDIEINATTEGFQNIKNNIKNVRQDIPPIKQDFTAMKNSITETIGSIKNAILLLCIILILSSIILGANSIGLFL